MASESIICDEKTIAGPFHIFDDSIVVEFLDPDESRDASFLMKVTYKAEHALSKLGKNHPQVPPYHLHFNQEESFHILSGKLGNTTSWDCVDRVWAAADGPQTIPRMLPHHFWPYPDSTDDCVLLFWAHPKDAPHSMGLPFFRSMLLYISDVYEKKVAMDLLQLMLLQHATASANIVFPRAKLMGALRWWLPYIMQASMAMIAGVLGRTSVLETYMKPEERAEFRNSRGLKKRTV